MGAEIKKVTLQIGKKEIELSIEDAKALKAALEGLFGQNIIRIEEHHHGYPWRWCGPIYHNVPLTNPGYEKWEITCGLSSVGASFQQDSGNMVLAVNSDKSL